MKMTFIVCNSYFNDRVMKLLASNGIDYYTSWDNAKGKGHRIWARDRSRARMR
jgi:hypothetical protein